MSDGKFSDSDADDADEPEEDATIHQVVGNLPGAVVTDADRKLYSVYNDHVHQNDGTHLDGGIGDGRVAGTLANAGKSTASTI